jgi:hypothetical protein
LAAGGTFDGAVVDGLAGAFISGTVFAGGCCAAAKLVHVAAQIPAARASGMTSVGFINSSSD